jgi:hypothetical protein
LQLVWRRTVEQIEKMFYIASLQPDEAFRSDPLTLLDESYVNLLHSQVALDEVEYEVRLDAVRPAGDRENLNLMIAILAEEEPPRPFLAMVNWGAYTQTAVTNRFGFAKFPPLNTALVFDASGQLAHDLELCLEVPDI